MSHAKILFEQMSRDLREQIAEGRIQLSGDIPEEVVICPLCLNVFGDGALRRKLLIPEHVPARKLGGKGQAAKTLTCRDCNHRHGSQFEGPLKQQLEYEEFGKFAAGAKAQGNLSVAGNEFNIQATIASENSFQINADSGHMRPEQFAKLRSLMQKEEWPALILTPKKKFQDRNAALGILRTGYLSMFSKFGYRFLCNPNLRAIRQQLMFPDQDILPDFGVVDFQVPGTLPDIGLVMQPAELFSYLVCISFSTELGTKFRCGLLLPLPRENDLSIYQYSRDYNQSKQWPELAVISYPTEKGGTIEG